jgi:hypothetical protein
MTYHKVRKRFTNTAAIMKIPAMTTMISGRIFRMDSVDSSKNLNNPAEDGGRGASRRLLL